MTSRRCQLIGIAVLLMLPAGLASAQETRLEGELQDLGGVQRRVERDLDEVRVAEQDARARLEQATGELEDAEAELEDIEAALDAARADVAEATSNEEEAHAQLEQVTRELADTEEELVEKRERLDARVRAAFKYGQVAFVEAFVGTRDIAEFLNSGTYVASVLDGDRVLVEEVSGLLAEIEQQREQAQDLRAETEHEAAAAREATAEVELALQEQERLIARVRERREAHESALERLASDRQAIEAHLAGLAAESQRIEQQLAAIAIQQAEEEARRQAGEDGDSSSDGGDDGGDDAGGSDQAPSPPAQGGPAPSGQWLRPVGGPVTSPFGPRWGRNHNGVDLGAGMGTTVIASRGGTVVHAISSCHPTSSFGCGGGFGNYVTIAHDGGMATVYAHLSSLSVGVGQRVEAGSRVGGVGNSGNSYGPHLHFEVRSHGAPRNPCGYISC